MGYNDFTLFLLATTAAIIVVRTFTDKNIASIKI
jgi:hypothetical protein